MFSAQSEIDMPPLEVQPCSKLPARFKIDGYVVNQTTLSAAQLASLRRVFRAISTSSTPGCTRVRRVEIVGHASTEGSDSVNLRMGLRRAKVVKGHLESVFGISVAMGTITFDASTAGERSPIVVPETGESDRRRNRRVEITLLP